jgi:hypothetical protein
MTSCLFSIHCHCLPGLRETDRTIGCRFSDSGMCEKQPPSSPFPRQLESRCYTFASILPSTHGDREYRVGKRGVSLKRGRTSANLGTEPSRRFDRKAIGIPARQVVGRKKKRQVSLLINSEPLPEPVIQALKQLLRNIRCASSPLAVPSRLPDIAMWTF